MTIEEAIESVIVDKIKRGIIDNDMVATGALLNSVRLEVSKNIGSDVYSIIALDYIEELNYGLAPGDPMPTIEDLQVWIEAKGLDLNPWAVLNNIKKVGTTWYRIGGSNIITENINGSAFREVTNLAKEDLKDKIAREYRDIFTKFKR